MNPIISVIVPVYNVEKYLSECLTSLLNQTLSDIEIVCINDGSTDSSLEILNEFKRLDNRITIINKQNEGYGSACNAGLNAANGQYISIVESDDFVDEAMYSDLYSLGVTYNADIVKSSYYLYKDSSSEGYESVSKIDWNNQYVMPKDVFTIIDFPQFLYFHPSIWSCIYKRDFIESNSIRFVEPKGAGWADNPFQVQTLCLAERIVYTDNSYYFYRLNNPHSSSNIVNLSSPFDRSKEIHDFLNRQNITDSNILACLYKREMSYIDIVLGGIEKKLFEFAASKIIGLVSQMKESIVMENPIITDYERRVYNLCKDKEGVRFLMKEIKKRGSKVAVVKIE